jgi:hypothetical protein
LSSKNRSFKSNPAPKLKSFVREGTFVFFRQIAFSLRGDCLEEDVFSKDC